MDILIIGGGPAGLTAAIYAARAGKEVVVIEKEVCGGKITESPWVENIPGFTSISGQDFAENLTNQACSCGVDIRYEEVTKIAKENNTFHVFTDCQTYQTKCVIYAAGTKNRLLGLPDEEKLIGNGISFCVTCDGPMYKGKTVAVVGGGNSAITEAIELSKIAKNIVVIQNLPTLTCENTLKEQLAATDNVTVYVNKTVKNYNVLNGKVCGITIENTDGDIDTTDVSGVFLAIGLIPQTELIKPLAIINEAGYVLTGDDGKTSCAGLYAVGDCTDNTVKQVVTACSDGAKAAVSAVAYVNEI